MNMARSVLDRRIHIGHPYVMGFVWCMAILVLSWVIYCHYQRWQALQVLSGMQARVQQQQAAYALAKQTESYHRYLDEHALRDRSQVWLTPARRQHMQAWQQTYGLAPLHFSNLTHTATKTSSAHATAPLAFQRWQLETQSANEAASMRWLEWLQDSAESGSFVLRECEWLLTEALMIKSSCVMEWWYVAPT